MFLGLFVTAVSIISRNTGGEGRTSRGPSLRDLRVKKEDAARSRVWGGDVPSGPGVLEGEEQEC